MYKKTIFVGLVFFSGIVANPYTKLARTLGVLATEQKTLAQPQESGEEIYQKLNGKEYWDALCKLYLRVFLLELLASNFPQASL